MAYQVLWFLPNWHRIIQNVWLTLTLDNDIIRLFLSILCKLNYSSMHSVCGIRLAISKTSTHALTSTFGGVLIIDSAPKSLYTFTLGPIDTFTNVHFYQCTLWPMYTLTNVHFDQCTQEIPTIAALDPPTVSFHRYVQLVLQDVHQRASQVFIL